MFKIFKFFTDKPVNLEYLIHSACCAITNAKMTYSFCILSINFRNHCILARQVEFFLIKPTATMSNSLAEDNDPALSSVQCYQKRIHSSFMSISSILSFRLLETSKYCYKQYSRQLLIVYSMSWSGTLDDASLPFGRSSLFVLQILKNHRDFSNQTRICRSFDASSDTLPSSCSAMIT